MYDINPPGVFVSEHIIGHTESEERVRRVLAACNHPQYEIVRDVELPAMLERPEWKAVDGAAGERESLHEPILFFTRYEFDETRLEQRRQKISQANPGFDVNRVRSSLLGYHHFAWFNSGQDAHDIKPCKDHVCRPAWRLHSMEGCFHRCLYCGLVGYLITMTDTREFITRLDRLIDANPWEPTYLIDDVSDVLLLEPELGSFAELCEYFGRKDGRYLIVHTKSANVDFLEHLDHRGHTVMCWSLAARTQAGELEKVAGTMEERIEAARKCQTWRYHVRFKFKPIVPVRNWRDEAREMIRLMFERTKPDNLSMTCLAWMDFGKLERILDLDELDPAFVEAARKQRGVETDCPRLLPFPHEVRREIYEFYLNEIRAIDADVPVTISTESLPMWRDMGPKLGFRPDTFVCGCGSTAVPGLKCLPESPWKIAQPVDAWK